MRIVYAVLIVLTIMIVLVCLIHINPRLEEYINMDQIVPLSSVRDNLKTGDVLVFMGNSIKSAIVRAYLQCPATHVGMIIRMDAKKEDGTPIFPDAKSDIYVLDLGGRNVPILRDIIGRTGRSTKDVVLRPLKKVFKRSPASYIYGVVPVSRSIDISPDDVKEYFNCEFNWSPFSMFSFDYSNTKFKVCSTFISKLHDDFGVGVNSDKQHHEMTPADYFHAPGIYFIDTTL
jgi:hypothetical protein